MWAACLANQTLCHLRLHEWARAAACATLVLGRDEANAKALYRRATARMELGEPASISLQGRELWLFARARLNGRCLSRARAKSQSSRP